MVFIMIYLFVLDDSLTSKRFTTRTEELTKCYEPLQKLRVRLWPCKTGLSPIVQRRYFCDGYFCFMSWCLKFFVLLAPYVCFHILV